jgi:hypothetical protein
MPTGACKMCLLQKELRSSHFIPSAMYKYCYRGDHRPIRFGGGFVLPTDRQTQDYLLCGECEGILNEGGETYVADKLATWERTFPLFADLTAVPPEFNEGGMVVFFASKTPKVEVDKLIHFAMGMFWKASVHSWKGDVKEPRIDLGPYSEPVRKWLRKEASFPEHVYLTAIVSPPERAQITINDPYEGVRKEWRTFLLHVSGLLFMLSVGKTADDGLRWLCLARNPSKPVMIAETITGQFERLLAETFNTAYKTKPFLEAMKKVEEERKKS